MPIARTLSGYIARQFLLWCGAVFGTMISIAFLIDYIELLRRAGTRVHASWEVLLQMAALKLPHTAQDVMPFAILFATMLSFWRLTRSNELVAARAAGISAWAFLAPAVLAALTIGVLAVTLFNPIASTMEASYEKLESRILRMTEDPMSLSNGGLWLRQSDGAGGQLILHGEKLASRDLDLRDVGLFFLDSRGQFTARIEAQSARLDNGFWVVENGQRFRPGEPAEKFAAVRIATSLTARKIEESLASPDSMSFWELPGYISLLQASGFSAQRH
jgi:lipopolysaccharide export system permease protein